LSDPYQPVKPDLPGQKPSAAGQPTPAGGSPMPVQPVIPATPGEAPTTPPTPSPVKIKPEGESEKEETLRRLKAIQETLNRIELKMGK
jgi:hypothetical protein